MKRRVAKKIYLQIAEGRRTGPVSKEFWCRHRREWNALARRMREKGYAYEEN